MSNRMRFVCWKFLRLILVASAAGRFPEVLPLSAVVGGYDNIISLWDATAAAGIIFLRHSRTYMFSTSCIQF